MKILHQNVRGLSTSEAEITHALILHRPEVMSLTETWAALRPPPQWQDLVYTMHSIDGTRSSGRIRMGGGVSMLIRVPHRRIQVPACEDMTTIVVQVGSSRIASVYIKPAIGKERYKKCLQQLLKLCRGSAIIVGDWNARTTWWDKITNPAGNALSTWSLHNNFEVGFTPTPTCVNSRGFSTVDLFLTRGWKIRKPTILHGPWNGKSDHLMIRAQIERKSEINSRHPVRIPSGLFQKDNLIGVARSFYEHALPKVTARIAAASSAQELQEATDSLIENLRKPWETFLSKRPNRFRPGWNKSLDQLAQQRTRLLKGDEQSRLAGRLLDRQIKRQFRENRRMLLARATSVINQEDYKSALATMRFVERKQTQKQNTLNPEDFTKYFNDKQIHRPIIPLPNFTIPPNFKDYLSRALQSAKCGKAPGPDGISNEMLKIAPALTVQALETLWQQVGRLTSLPTQFNTGTLVPLYKSGEPREPSNYRPIMLLSHVRKCITGAIGLLIRDVYAPHHRQWGFCPNTNAEDAILAANESIRKGHNYLAVLDLKAAYDSVRRDDVLRICNHKLPQYVNAMLPAVLQPQRVTTQGQNSSIIAHVTMGVPQGDRPSPDIFNIFIDILLFMLDKVPRPFSDHPANAYADEILLLSRSAEGLQRLLNIATKWSQHYNMAWNISKCSILAPPQNTDVLSLNNSNLLCLNEATYLGVPLSAGGVTDSNNKKRTEKAIALMERIR